MSIETQLVLFELHPHDRESIFCAVAYRRRGNITAQGIAFERAPTIATSKSRSFEVTR